MRSSIDPISDQFLAALDHLSRKAQTTQQSISSGRRIGAPSDAPEDVGTVLRLQNEISRSQQARANLSRIQSDVESGETALQGAVELLDAARVAGVQGANDTLSTVERVSLADYVSSLLERMIGISKSSIEGRFIFSGANDGSPAYSLNLSSPKGVDRLMTMTPGRAVEDPGGAMVQSGLTAEEIFDPSDAAGNAMSGNSFAALNNLRLALGSNSTAGIQSALAELTAASDHMNQKLAYYGNLQNRIQSASDLAVKFELQWNAALSAVRDTDMPAAIVELRQNETQMEAAIQAQASVRRKTLFDYLG